MTTKYGLTRPHLFTELPNLMKKLSSVFLRTTVLLCVLSSNSFAAVPPFKPGETIRYSIHKLLLQGEATLVYKGPCVFKNKKALLIVFTSKAFNFYDQEKIYLGVEDFRPIHVDRNINIFGRKERIFEGYFDGRIEVTKIDAGGRKSKQTIENKNKVDNIYGFIYRYRAQGSFKEGDDLNIHLPTKDLTIKLLRQEKVDAAKQVFDSYYMESTASGYKIWFDAGSHKLPLRISDATGPGDTVMTMKDYRE